MCDQQRASDLLIEICYAASFASWFCVTDMDVGSGGTGGTCPPPNCLKTRTKCSSALVAFLENVEVVEINKKCTFSTFLENLSFKISGEACP